MSEGPTSLGNLFAPIVEGKKYVVQRQSRDEIQHEPLAEVFPGDEFWLQNDIISHALFDKSLKELKFNLRTNIGRKKFEIFPRIFSVAFPEIVSDIADNRQKTHSPGKYGPRPFFSDIEVRATTYVRFAFFA